MALTQLANDHLRALIRHPDAAEEIIDLLEGEAAQGVEDDVAFPLGDGSDQALISRSTALDANTALTGVLIGTPAVAAIPANSLIVSNVTADGDQVFATVPASGSNSIEWLRNDASAGITVFNEASGDIDLRIESNVLSNFLVIDANSCLNGQIAFGGAVPTNPQAFFSILPAVNASGVTANQSYFHATVLPGAAVTIPTGTAPIVASVNIAEPNITATGTVTDAATLRIADAPTEGGTGNWALWVDAGVTRLDGNMNVADAAWDLIGKANTAAAVEITDGTTSIVSVDTRNTVKDVSSVTLTASAPTVASEGAAHINATLRVAAKTITYTGTTGTTSSLGTQAHFGATTITDASSMTLTTASAIHITALAAAGGMLTISNSRMISTSVSDCFLTNAGVWTDTACWESGKELVMRGVEHAASAIDSVMEKLMPATWRYRAETALPGIDDEGNPTIHRTKIDDRGRNRVGIIYDDLPEELRAPGEERGVSAGILSSFALAAIKQLWEQNRALEARLARLETV